MTIHIDSGDGGAKCGCNVFYDDYPNGYNNPKVIPAVRKIMKRKHIYFENLEKGLPANCKRCLNQLKRPKTIISNEDLTKKVFHYSFGYDMTINVFARAISKTPKGWLCQELNKYISGEAYGPGSNGTAKAGGLKSDSKPFLMLKKESAHGYTYFTGNGHTWSLVDESKSFYENHWD